VMALKGIKVLEMAGLAPGPFCGMVLRDFGATVIRVDRVSPIRNLSDNIPACLSKCRDKGGTYRCAVPSPRQDCSRQCLANAGVMERVGLGPDVLLQTNPRLVYARITGFGQTGPFSMMAGHDINYLALSGVLSMLGEHGRKPIFPVNVIADFGGGGLLAALGICMALLERTRSGRGQVVDTSMASTRSAYLSSFLWRTRSSNMAVPIWIDERGKNILDGGTHFYNVYETKDRKYMSVGALEPNFYKELSWVRLGLEPDTVPQMGDWEESKRVFAEIFATKTQDEWCRVFDQKDACVVPVLDHDTAHKHPHNASREAFHECSDGPPIPRPAPRLDRTPAEPDYKEPLVGEHSVEVLKEAGLSDGEIRTLLQSGTVEAPCFDPNLRL
ncbi:alpha-methylacyl-CoA racemase, putative, partial [Ixodes scapularis]